MKFLLIKMASRNIGITNGTNCTNDTNETTRTGDGHGLHGFFICHSLPDRESRKKPCLTQSMPSTRSGDAKAQREDLPDHEFFDKVPPELALSASRSSMAEGLRIGYTNEEQTTENHEAELTHASRRGHGADLMHASRHGFGGGTFDVGSSSLQI